jgi:hypothetical protein
MLKRDLEALEWRRALRWPLLILAVAASIYALVNQGTLAWILAAVAVAAAVTFGIQDAAMHHEIGFLEQRNESEEEDTIWW